MARKDTPKRRTIGSAKFNFASSHTTKSAARKKARQVRKGGRRSRVLPCVVKGKNKFCTYNGVKI